MLAKKKADMFIDGISGRIVDHAALERIDHHPALDFTKSFSLKTGEVNEYRQPARHRNMKFTPKRRKWEMQVGGNLPEFYTGLKNLGPPSWSETVNAIDAFSETFGISASNVLLTKLEVGINIKTVETPKFIMDNLITFRNRRKDVASYRNKGYSNAFKLDNYDLLLYDKGKKHQQPDNILRVELITRSKLLKQLGTTTLEDLKHPSKMNNLYSFLRSRIDDCVFDDRSMSLEKLKENESRLITKYRDIVNWEDLNGYNNDNCRKKKARFREIVEQNCNTNWREWFNQQFEEALINNPELNKVKFPGFPM